MRRRGFLGLLVGSLFACCTRLIPDLAPVQPPWRGTAYVTLVAGPFAGINCRCTLAVVATPEQFGSSEAQIRACSRRYGMTDHPKRIPVVPKGRLTDGP